MHSLFVRLLTNQTLFSRKSYTHIELKTKKAALGRLVLSVMAV